MNLKQLQNCTKKTFEYPTKNGETLEGYLHTPLKEQENYPTVFYFHGGGFRAGSKDNAFQGTKQRVLQNLIDSGFCVVCVDYIQDGKIKKCIENSKDAIKFIIKSENKVDPENLFAFGDSAGGHLALMVSFTEPEDFNGSQELNKLFYKMKGAVSWYGPTDFSKLDERRWEDRLKDESDEEKDDERIVKELSPATYAAGKKLDVLLVHGDEDTTIPVYQSIALEKTRLTNEMPGKTLIVKNAGHNFKGDQEKFYCSKSLEDLTRGRIVTLTTNFFTRKILKNV